MGQGQGSITRESARNVAAAPPPATVTAANNGLSLSGTTAVLGNDENAAALAALLNDREIVTGAFSLLLKNIINPGTTSEAQLNAFGFQVSNSGSGIDPRIFLDRSATGESIELQASTLVDARISLVGAAPNIQFGDGIATYRMQSTFGQFNLIESISGAELLNIDGIALNFLLGDTSAFGNGTLFEIDDGTLTSTIRTTAGRMLFLDQGTGIYRMGDFDFVGNGTSFFANDTSFLAGAETGNGGMLMLDQLNGLYLMGDLNGIGNTSVLAIDDTSSIWNLNAGAFGSMQQDAAVGFMINQGGGNRLEILNTNLYNFGDINTTNNGLTLSLNDNTGVIDFYNAALNAAFSVNGVNGFTGTVTPVTSITVNGGIVTAVS